MSFLRFLVWSVAFLACVTAAFLYGFYLRPAETSNVPVRLSFIAAAPDDFYQVAIAGARDAAKEVGAEVDVIIPTSSNEQSTILAGIDDDAVDGVAISILSPRTQSRMLSLLATEVPVVTYDNDAPQSLRNCYIGTDNYSGGQLSAEIVKEILPDGGKVAIFIGDVERNNAQLRRLGFLDKLFDRSRSDEGSVDPVDQLLEGAGYTVVGTYLDDHDEARAADNVKQAINEHDDLAVLVGLYGYNAPACVSVVQELGKQDQIKIVGFDEHAETIKGIDEGLVAGTVVQNPYRYGFDSISMLTTWHRDSFTEPSKGGVAPVMIPCRKVTSENLEEFRSETAKYLKSADADADSSAKAEAAPEAKADSEAEPEAE